MHAVPDHLDEQCPCNAYCEGEVHVDVEYAHPSRFPAHVRSLTDQLRRALSDWNTVEILAIAPAPEAVPCARRYPDNVQRLAASGLAPEAWVPFRITYRLRQVPRQKGDV